MTTIAYRDGVLASDSRATINGYVRPQRDVKLFRRGDGGVAAMTGESGGCFRLLKWIDGDRAKDQPDGDFRVILLHVDGRLEVFEGGGSYPLECEFNAWGSGMSAALGALHMGATAGQAVEAAILVDSLSGGDVVEMRAEARGQLKRLVPRHG